MITPLELEKLEFEKKLGGYKCESVDEWFNIIKNDYNTVYKENIALKDKIGGMEELISKYKAMEDTLQSSILLAQQTGEKAISTANSEAELIVSRAKDQAEAIISEAKSERQKLTEKSEDIRKNIAVFAAKNISMLRSQIELLNQINTDSLTSTFRQDITEE